MKKYCFIFVFSFWLGGFSQTIPSTVSEAFSFSIGDSFVYRAVLCPNCLLQFRQESYFYIAITGKYNSASSDTLFYETNLGLKVFTNLDSSVLAHSLQPINYIPFGSDYCFYSAATSDSVFIDSACYEKKNNQSSTYLSLSCMGSSLYANGLGLIHRHTRDSGFPSDPSLNWDLDLIYNSTQSGICGSYPPSIFTDISASGVKVSSVSLAPNPATTSFTLQLSSSPITETHLLLYDALGREVKREQIISTITTLQRNQLPAGIYYWQLQSGSAMAGRGKIIFE